MQDKTKEQMSKMTSNFIQYATEMNAITHDTTTAILQSFSVIVKGCGDLCDSLNSLSQKYIDQYASLSTTMMSANSVNDLVNTQNGLIKSNLDSVMSDVSNITQLSSRIAQQAAEPVTKHVNQTISKISKIRAA